MIVNFAAFLEELILFILLVDIYQGKYCGLEDFELLEGGVLIYKNNRVLINHNIQSLSSYIIVLFISH